MKQLNQKGNNNYPKRYCLIAFLIHPCIQYMKEERNI